MLRVITPSAGVYPPLPSLCNCHIVGLGQNILGTLLSRDLVFKLKRCWERVCYYPCLLYSSKREEQHTQLKARISSTLIATPFGLAGGIISSILRFMLVAIDIQGYKA